MSKDERKKVKVRRLGADGKVREVERFDRGEQAAIDRLFDPERRNPKRKAEPEATAPEE